jgi:hypothetical protein
VDHIKAFTGKFGVMTINRPIGRFHSAIRIGGHSAPERDGVGNPHLGILGVLSVAEGSSSTERRFQRMPRYDCPSQIPVVVQLVPYRVRLSPDRVQISGRDIPSHETTGGYDQTLGRVVGSVGENDLIVQLGQPG